MSDNKEKGDVKMEKGGRKLQEDVGGGGKMEKEDNKPPEDDKTSKANLTKGEPKSLTPCMWCQVLTSNECMGVRCRHLQHKYEFEGKKEPVFWYPIAALCLKCEEKKDVCFICKQAQAGPMRRRTVGDCWRCAAANPRFRCTRCGEARYCGLVCQKMDWGEHKKSCIVTTNETVKSIDPPPS